MRPMRARGFTMVEIMVALAIVAMLLMFAAPNAATWIQNTRLRSAAESVASCLQTARLEAIKRNTVVSCQMTDTTSSAWNVCLYDAVNNVCLAAQPVLANRDKSEDNGITTLGLDTTASPSATALAPGNNVPGSTTFDSFGRLAATAPNNAMRVDIRNVQLAAADERRLVIYISLGGQIHMCDPKVPFATNPQGCAV
jgi:type IV fimbrial biogenesis protein FimT